MKPKKKSSESQHTFGKTILRCMKCKKIAPEGNIDRFTQFIKPHLLECWEKTVLSPECFSWERE